MHVSSFQKKEDNSVSVGENKDPIFVRIQTLTKGDSFVSTVLFTSAAKDIF